MNTFVAGMLGADLSNTLLDKKLGVFVNCFCTFIGWYWKDDGCMINSVLKIFFYKSGNLRFYYHL